LPEPAQDRARRPRLRFQGKRGGVDPQDDVRVLAHGERHTAATAIPGKPPSPVTTVSSELAFRKH
jgi:hypothetical protein